MFVNWDVGYVGYDKLKEVLGGGLKLDVMVDVILCMGNWVEIVYYEGKGIGVKVRI